MHNQNQVRLVQWLGPERQQQERRQQQEQQERQQQDGEQERQLWSLSKNKIMIEKIENARRIIDLCFRHAKKPALAWSGGKDSMALLGLVVQQGYNPPVVFFREQWQPHKYAFQNRIIEEWGLEVYTWHPAQSFMQQNDDEFEIQNRYVFDNTDFTCPTGITNPVDGQPWACGFDIYNRPKSILTDAGWDGMLIGHKLCDSDPIYGGDSGVRVDVRINPNQCNAFYPMKDWTHDDVFQFCEDFNIPIQESRYEKTNGKWSEKSDRSQNCDYVHACVKCLDRRSTADKFINCPKMNCTIENISSRVKWFDQSIPTFMKD